MQYRERSLRKDVQNIFNFGQGSVCVCVRAHIEFKGSGVSFQCKKFDHATQISNTKLSNLVYIFKEYVACSENG